MLATKKRNHSEAQRWEVEGKRNHNETQGWEVERKRHGKAGKAEQQKNYLLEAENKEEEKFEENLTAEEEVEWVAGMMKKRREMD